MQPNPIFRVRNFFYRGGEKRVKSKKFVCERDGLKIRGRVWGSGEGKKPAVLLSHGFLANQRMCFTYAKLLAKIGYIAFTFDFNGGGLFSRSQGKSEDMTIMTEKADLLAVFKAVRERSDVDREHISLLGCSQGGLVSALLAKELNGEVERLILLYPALCIPDDARAGSMLFYRFDPENIPNLLGHFPMKLGGDYARSVITMNVYKEISGFEGKVLYLQGTADRIVDVSYARRGKECFSDCDYREIEGGGHMFSGKHDKIACEILSDFMRRG